MKTPVDKHKLAWTRRELSQASGLSYKTIVNLEKRGLLRRCMVGVNVAIYSHSSVIALFGDKAAQPAQSA